MDFHEINMIGKMYIEEVATLPTWTGNDVRRLIYNAADGYVYCGSTTEWIQWTDSGDVDDHMLEINPHLDSAADSTLTLHTDATNPHTSSASVTDLTSHTIDYNDPHNTLSSLTDSTSGYNIFAQEEDCVTLAASGSDTMSVYFDNTYQMGSMTYGLVNSDVDDGINWKKWIRDGSSNMIGFELEYDLIDQIDSETLQYSMFGIVNVDVSKCDITIDTDCTPE